MHAAIGGPHPNLVNERKPRVVVLGAAGMLGRALVRVLSRQGYDVTAVMRPRPGRSSQTGIARNVFLADFINARAIDALIRSQRPRCILNAAGLKVAFDPADPAALLRVNSLLPRIVAEASAAQGVRVLHFSTNAAAHYLSRVDSGATDSSVQDLYALSKLLGEIEAEHVVNIRCSMIGLDSSNEDSLLEWFLRSRGPATGYSRAMFNGLPVDEIATICGELLLPRIDRCSGILNVGGPTISKADLLRLVAHVWQRPDLDVVDRPEPHLDQTLDCTRLKTEFGYKEKGWPEMIATTRKYYENE